MSEHREVLQGGALSPRALMVDWLGVCLVEVCPEDLAQVIVL